MMGDYLLHVQEGAGGGGIVMQISIHCTFKVKKDGVFINYIDVRNMQHIKYATPASSRA